MNLDWNFPLDFDPELLPHSGTDTNLKVDQGSVNLAVYTDYGPTVRVDVEVDDSGKLVLKAWRNWDVDASPDVEHVLAIAGRFGNEIYCIDCLKSLLHVELEEHADSESGEAHLLICPQCGRVQERD